jgi:hypothetical protein
MFVINYIIIEWEVEELFQFKLVDAFSAIHGSNM